MAVQSRSCDARVELKRVTFHVFSRPWTHGCHVETIVYYSHPIDAHDISWHGRLEKSNIFKRWSLWRSTQALWRRHAAEWSSLYQAWIHGLTDWCQTGKSAWSVGQSECEWLRKVVKSRLILYENSGICIAIPIWQTGFILLSSSQHASRILAFAHLLRTCETHVNSHHELGDAESKCIANASANVLSARVRDVSKHFPPSCCLWAQQRLGRCVTWRPRPLIFAMADVSDMCFSSSVLPIFLYIFEINIFEIWISLRY